MILGTPAYAAPEMRAGGAATRATDVCGLALNAHEMLGPVDPCVAAVLRFGLFDDPAGRPSRSRVAREAIYELGLLHHCEERVLSRAERAMGREVSGSRRGRVYSLSAGKVALAVFVGSKATRIPCPGLSKATVMHLATICVISRSASPKLRQPFGM